MDNRNTAAETIARYKQTIAIRTAVAVVLAVVVVVLAALAFYLGALPKKMPYVIELSSDGEAYYHANTVDLLRDWTPSDATQRYFISRYVSDLRSVSIDNYVNKDHASSVYSKSLSKATELVTSWYGDNNPIDRSRTEYVVIPSDEMSVVLYSDSVWKVSWRETTYRRSDGTMIADRQYEGLFSVSFYTPDTERRKRENPIGMYITDFETNLIGSLM